jgi:hypothetical protein
MEFDAASPVLPALLASRVSFASVGEWLSLVEHLVRDTVETYRFGVG